MKRCLFLLFATLFAAPLSAQVLDSLLLNRDIFEILNSSGIYGNRVTLILPETLRSAIQNQMVQNGSKTIQGYRIRIFNSNAQTARVTSQTIKEEFESRYPHIRAYPKFEPPDFRVLVGDFRTKSEAIRFLNEIRVYPQYRSAVVVKEAIAFPAL